jgi:anti-anti-sigma regulatory factor
MLRITEHIEDAKAVRLRLDGTLSVTCFAEIEEACDRCRNEPGKIILLDMAGVVFMDNDSASRIARLRGEQLRVINCSPFIETLLSNVAL